MTTPRQILKGSKTLADWWLEGREPVSKDHAQARANICKACPMNQDPTLFERLTAMALKKVVHALAWKKHQGWTLVDDPDLKICEACGCNLQLKVWTPIEIIQKNSSATELSSFHRACWIRSEVKPL